MRDGPRIAAYSAHPCCPRALIDELLGRHPERQPSVWQHREQSKALQDSQGRHAGLSLIGGRVVSQVGAPFRNKGERPKRGV